MSNTPFLPSTLTLVGQVQNPAVVQNTDGSLSTLEMGRGGDVLASDVRGKYGSMAHRGGVYWAASTTAGIAVPINTEVSGATNTFGLNNPAGSGVMAELIDVDLTFLGAGPGTTNTTVGFSILNTALNALTAITATPGPIHAGGNPSRFDGPNPVCTHFSLATHASTLLVTNFYPLFTFPTTYQPTAAVNIGPWHYDFNGKLVVPPGFAITMTVNGTALAAATLVPQMFWAEYKI